MPANFRVRKIYSFWSLSRKIHRDSKGGVEKKYSLQRPMLKIGIYA